MVGDRISVVLDKGDLGYNLQYNYFEEITDITMREMENALGERECSTLEYVFDSWDGDMALGTYLYSTTADTLVEQEGAGSLSELLEFIASGEGGYNSMNQGTAGPYAGNWTHDASTILGQNLTDMTITEVQRFHALPNTDPQRLFAAGRYQIIPDTLTYILSRTPGVNADSVYSAETQDLLGMALIYYGQREDLRKYLTGESDDLYAAHMDLAREWASVPHPTRS